MSDDQHRRAIDVMWDLLDSFLSESGTLLGTREIFRGYRRWENETYPGST